MAVLFKWSGDDVGGFDHEATSFNPAFAYSATGTRARLLYSAGSGASLMGKSPLGDVPSVAVRFTMELTGYPPWGAVIAWPLDSTGASAWSIRVSGSGALLINDSASATVLTSASIPLNQEVRVEALVSAGTFALRVYSTRDGNALLVDSSATGTFLPLGNLRIGRALSSPDLPPLYLDDVLVTDGADWTGAPVNPTPQDPAWPRVGIIGDSLTSMSGANGQILHAALTERGYPTRNAYLWGVGGKRIADPDLTGRGSLLNVDDAMTQLGGVDQWIIALGTNDRPYDDATVNASIDALLGKIDAVTPGALVIWVGISALAFAGADDIRVNNLIRAKVESRPNSVYADWDAHIRAIDGGANPSPYWLDDTTHMTTEGYEVRSEFYVDQLDLPSPTATAYIGSSAVVAAYVGTTPVAI